MDILQRIELELETVAEKTRQPDHIVRFSEYWTFQYGCRKMVMEMSAS
jgi:hypothetical protein